MMRERVMPGRRRRRRQRRRRRSGGGGINENSAAREKEEEIDGGSTVLGKKKTIKDKQNVGRKDRVKVRSNKDMPPTELHGDPFETWKTFMYSPMLEEEQKFL
ncbi:uncharacterized protein A4U43_C05F3910 [Asparagus officinalis]|uniref:Uncharacterized protein n=1 Tax=Asparagus officinalis TaxID=4686 RepID=A0A5P1EUL8_ASPOF|nr:uncharacterized protein A4U43_C05F3910 [Asparagus officinalis]